MILPSDPTIVPLHPILLQPYYTSSARPAPGRKFWNNETAMRNQWPIGKFLRSRSSEWLKLEVHQRKSEWLLRWQWAERIHVQLTQWSNQSWFSESMNQWIMKRQISKSMNQRINGSTIEWVNESMNEWINESMEWIIESRKEWINEFANLILKKCSDPSFLFDDSEIQIDLSLQSGAHFADLIFQKCSDPHNFCDFGVQNKLIEMQIELWLQFGAHFADLIFQKYCGVVSSLTFWSANRILAAV